MSFKFLTLEERNRRLEAENNLLRAKNQQLEDALLELAQYVSEVKHGETVCTEDNE
jgi:cell division protein FtsB